MSNSQHNACHSSSQAGVAILYAPKARKLPQRGWLDSLFRKEVGVLISFHSLKPALSPIGFTHVARMSEEFDTGCPISTSNFPLCMFFNGPKKLH
tara:strand:- start:256 stop:540 length:285 start_codon:yes stop_codon:yes gene_type:complete